MRLRFDPDAVPSGCATMHPIVGFQRQRNVLRLTPSGRYENGMSARETLHVWWKGLAGQVRWLSSARFFTVRATSEQPVRHSRRQ